jgi:hypothetical protein
MDESPLHTFDLPSIAALLSKSVGDDMALSVVRDAARKLGVIDAVLDQDCTLEILAVVATNPGLIGVSARFCRSRLIAQFSREDLERRR